MWHLTQWFTANETLSIIALELVDVLKGFREKLCFISMESQGGLHGCTSNEN